MERLEKIGEGKTKIIWSTSNPNLVIIETKDDITAGDGVKHDLIEGLGALRNETTCNCFQLLEEKGISTHFIRRIDGTSFLARKCQMIPIELVVRVIAFGSFLKRNPDVKEGDVFANPVIEFFLKDDQRHDPLMIWKDKSFQLFDAKKPVSQETFLGNLSESTLLIPNNGMTVKFFETIAISVFKILRHAWFKQNVVLVDLKIELGQHVDNHKLLVADVVDNDSWRIWPGGDKGKMKDKQVYRDNELDADLIQRLLDNYAWVVRATGKFLS